MTKFSANLGLLWTELSLPAAIRAAAVAGFDAVECHWPYDTPAATIKSVLEETGLQMLGINTIPGEPGDNGLAALPGREEEAHAAIDQAIDYAIATNTKAVHVMAGISVGDLAHKTFISNLRYACKRAKPGNIIILIEPLNQYDAPGYFLQTSEQALKIIEEVNKGNLKMIFDCYHIQIMEGDLTRRLDNCQGAIGHVQFASVPDRTEPSSGEVNYKYIFAYLKKLGYVAPLGAEYKPNQKTELTLGWMRTIG